MKMRKKNLDEKTYAEMLAEYEREQKNLRGLLRAMDNTTAKEWCRTQIDDTLRFVCYEIALPAEFYELCQMMKDELDKRGKKLYNICGAGSEV